MFRDSKSMSNEDKNIFIIVNISNPAIRNFLEIGPCFSKYNLSTSVCTTYIIHMVYYVCTIKLCLGLKRKKGKTKKDIGEETQYLEIRLVIEKKV